MALPMIEQMMALIVITPDTGKLALISSKNADEFPIEP